MKHIFFILALLMVMMSGCAPYRPVQSMNGGRPGPTAVTMPGITYIVPADVGLVRQQGLIEDLVFINAGRYGYGTQKRETSKLLGNMIVTRYNGNAIDTIFSKLASDNSILVERRLSFKVNPSIGAGKRYYVNFTDTKNETGYKVTLQPTKSETYQDKIILPMEVPEFDERDLRSYLLATEIFYRFEVNSEFNSESVYANFARLLKTSAFGAGETDPVTGKIFKQQFILSYQDQLVFFTLETFPYHNGSKVVMYLRVPAILTSPNTVDYGVILDNIKANLKRIVQS